MRHSYEFTSFAASEAAKRLGERIRQARKAQHLTLKALEHQCRVHRTTLSRLEKGDPNVTFAVVLMVLEALGELQELELVLSQPHVPRTKREGAVVELDTDF
ncbi:helix-turn-helix domain-containing protein [Noviherbaspirillum pedocola]|jgi:transcriptional regulator with XRE-family HTH domain|uniref:Helix-turn-helix transcriptional regulator n=1 Tax=Noviherbaspirillum pedocola TaxID=2801341 RepID=A0A934T0C4_9BURK|nr:helix-turn-helix transcriptional regulator [Noviherbaspirillum pedocola]MBK4738650.1 helix-turn-helix transcriptional regulator [Noviherbaspirillum pedocola]